MEREPWGPASVQGSEASATVVFREDSRGDLVDIDFYCADCDAREDCEGANYWPCYDFSPDYETRCADCGALIHRPYGLEED